jgi:hypothetical protein
VHAPTRLCVRAVHVAARDAAIEATMPWLAAVVATRGREVPARIVRNVRLGDDAAVRDRLAGRVALRVHRLLEGDLDPLLAAVRER